MIIKPVDLTLANQGLFFEVNNRGTLFSLAFMNDTLANADRTNPTSPADFGNGFLQRQGYTLAWVGWQGDLLPENNRLTAQLPVATQDVKPITEQIVNEFFDVGVPGGNAVFTLPLSGNSTVRSYESISKDQSVAQAELRVRSSDSPRPSAPDIPEGDVVPNSQWSFAKCPTGPPGTPSSTDICLAGGFRSDTIYQLIYRAKNPTVMGLGYVTTRDFVSFLRHVIADDSGNPNPVPGITTVLGWAHSSSGQYLRDLLYQGFNEDEQGRPVFDGINVHTSGAYKIFLNYRFAQPDRTSQQHNSRYTPMNDFPRTYAVRQGPLRQGNADGILKRPATDPKVIHTVSSREYWQLQASLVDTDEDGTVDIDQPQNVRDYLFSSTQHGRFKGDVPGGNCQQLNNPIQYQPLARALLVALDEWVRDGTEPPRSRVPRIADETLIAPDQYCSQFPSIPGVNCNGLYNASGDRDFGPRVSHHSGVIDNLVPAGDQILNTHRVLVPAADEIGNDIAGIRHPFVEAPIATVTGWNLRRPEFTDGDLCALDGMWIPLFTSKGDRLAAGDQRPSLEELYRDHNGYVKAVRRAARKLARHRLLLEEDVEQIISEAEESEVLK
jgi:hypothetical protein